MRDLRKPSCLEDGLCLSLFKTTWYHVGPRWIFFSPLAFITLPWNTVSSSAGKGCNFTHFLPNNRCKKSLVHTFGLETTLKLLSLLKFTHVSVNRCCAGWTAEMGLACNSGVDIHSGFCFRIFFLEVKVSSMCLVTFSSLLYSQSRENSITTLHQTENFQLFLQEN